MTSVFIGGSRAVSRLNEPIREQLENLLARRCHILIGDANGADRAVQQYLAEHRYRSVTVYTADTCRNNVGGWPSRQVHPDRPRRGFAYYAAKDLAMAQAATCGVMLWDGRSRGTLHNIYNLVQARKKVLVYLAPERLFYKLASEAGLQELLSRCDPRDIERAGSGLPFASLQRQPHLPLQSP